MSGPFTACLLLPQVFKALRERLEEVVKSRAKLVADLGQIKAANYMPGQKQLAINRAVEAHITQLRSAVQVGCNGGAGSSGRTRHNMCPACW